MIYNQEAGTFTTKVNAGFTGTAAEKAVQELIAKGASAWECNDGSGWAALSKDRFVEFEFDADYIVEGLNQQVPFLGAAKAVNVHGEVGIILGICMDGLQWPAGAALWVKSNDYSNDTYYFFLNRTYDQDFIFTCRLDSNLSRVHINPGNAYARIADGLNPIAYTQYDVGNTTSDGIPNKLFEAFTRLGW